MLAGLTVYAVPQVLAATLPIGALANQVGTVVKLVRVLMLGPVVLGFSLLLAACGRRTAINQRRPALTELVPSFIIGFLTLLVLRSLGFIPQALLPRITRTAAIMTSIAMAGFGLRVDVGVVARTGFRACSLGHVLAPRPARADELWADPLTGMV